MQRTVASAPHVRRYGLAISLVSLLAIGFATLLPEPDQQFDQHWCLICGSFGGVDAFLNVLLFVPLGVGLALSELSGIGALGMMCGLSLLIETAQFLVIPGRDSTFGDVVTNTLGGAVGFALARYAWTWLRPSPRVATVLTVGWCALWLAIQAISNYGFVPSLPESPYYGQLARDFGNFAVFNGRVIDARANDVVIPNSVLADSHAIRRALLNGAVVETTVVPAGPTQEIAPIVRVADADEREILVLAQHEANLLFGIRSGAAVLRLRRPLFVLPYVFPSQAAGKDNGAIDTLNLSGRYLPQGVTMKAQTRLATLQQRILITASLGWMLLLPFDWQIAGTRAELVLSCIWTACLVVPFGYWAARIAPADSQHDGLATRWLLLLFGIPLAAVGFLLIPTTFGVSIASFRDWCCALAGLLAGHRLARRLT